LRTALFWAITQRVVVIPYRRFTPHPPDRVVVDLRRVN